jgi:ABC-type nitrate/sulfonate/bicarbonate transport system permease component
MLRTRRDPDVVGAARVPGAVWASLGLIVFLIVWEIVARFIVNDPLALVPPTALAERLPGELTDATFWNDVQVSLLEYVYGMVIAIGGGIALGGVIGGVWYLRRMFEPLVTALYATPSLALAPLFIVALGIGQLSKVAIIAFVAGLPIAISTIAGVAAVDSTFHDVSAVYRTPTLRKFFRVTVPASLPTIMAGVRIGAGRGVLGIVLGEFFGASAGLGFRILLASQSFDVARLLIAVIALALLALAVTNLVGLIERRYAS